MRRFVTAFSYVVFILLGLAPAPARSQQPSAIHLPILVPVTGFVALEGTSQRNGALLALKNAHDRLPIDADVIDTGATPEGAVTAFQRALAKAVPPVAVAPILGTQMLALLPLAEKNKVPLVTISGTAKVTEMGNPWVFRFFPDDSVVKVAQARYVVEKLGRKKPALLYQTTAYGQSGREILAAQFAKMGTPLVYEEGLATSVKDVLPALTKAKAAGADVLVLQLHAPTTALVVSQAHSLSLKLPIVAGSAMHQPATAALLSPKELRGVCAETASSPISGGNPAMQRFAADYRRQFNGPPDAFAVAQYDGMAMVIEALIHGARTGDQVRAYLASGTHKGLAMTYRSDGSGNMAHDALIVCYDGKSRVPKIVERYTGSP